MKAVKLALMVLVLAMCSWSTAVRAADAPAKAAPAKKSLASSYSVTVGDMVALNLTNLLNAMKPIDAPMMVAYDNDEKKLEVAIFGGRSSVDGFNGAKASIEEFLAAGKPMVEMVCEQFGIELADNQLRVLYFNRNDSFKLIVTRDNGVYLMQ